jgi:hypothetical protein
VRRPRVGSAARCLAQLAVELAEACAASGLPPPGVRMPEREELRAVNPTLANRIEALPGRNGWRRLAAFVGSEAALPPVRRRKRSAATLLRRLDDVEYLRAQLRPFQAHARVVPCLHSLPSELRSAVRRHGGVGEFARVARMLRLAEWQHFVRFGSLLDALCAVLYGADAAGGWLRRVEAESREEAEFPTGEEMRAVGMHAAVQTYGGRRALGARLGFRRQKGGIYMGAFSVTFAAELVRYAVDVAAVTPEGYLAMPRVEWMLRDGRGDLATLCERFGGAAEVGRRVGLVPVEGMVPVKRVLAQAVVTVGGRLDKDEADSF